MTLLQFLIKDFKILFRYKKLILFSIVFPLLVLLILGFIFSDIMNYNRIVEKKDIVIVNNDVSQASHLLISNFKENESFTNLFNIKEYEKELALEKYEDGDILALVEIPKGFSRSLLNFKNNKIYITLNPLKPLESMLFENVMDSYKNYVLTTDIAVYTLYEKIKNIGLSSSELNKINDAFSLEMIITALGRNDFFNFNQITTIPSSTSIEYFTLAIGVLFIMYTGLIGMNLIIYERNSMCLNRYRISTGSISIFILSKILVLFIFSMFQITIFIVPIYFILNLQTIFSISSVLFFVSISIIQILSISVLLGTFIKNEELATLIGNIGIFILALIGGSFIPLQMMPSQIQYLSRITPNYWIIKGLLFIIKGYDLSHIVTNIYIIIITTITFIVVSIIRLKK